MDNPPPPYAVAASGAQTLQVDMPPSYEEAEHGQIQASGGAFVSFPIQAAGGVSDLQTVTPRVPDDQPQRVVLSGSREMNNAPPPYETAAYGAENVQVDMPPSYEEAEHGQIQASGGAFVAFPMQAVGGVRDPQTVTPRVPDDQPLTVVLSDSREMNYAPPPYETAAQSAQNLQVDMSPSYEEAEHQQETFV